MDPGRLAHGYPARHVASTGRHVRERCADVEDPRETRSCIAASRSVKRRRRRRSINEPRRWTRSSARRRRLLLRAPPPLPPATAAALTPSEAGGGRRGTSAISSAKEECLSFAASVQEGLRYVKALLLGQAKKMRARNEREATEADLRTAKTQADAADAAEKRIHDKSA